MEEPTSTADANRNEHMLNSLRQIEQEIDLHSPRSEALAAFEPICRLVISEMIEFFTESVQRPHRDREKTDGPPQEAPFTNEVIGLLCTLCVRLRLEGLFLEISSFDFQKMSRPSQTEPSLFPAIGMGIAVFGPGTLEPNLTLSLTRVLSFDLRCTMIDLIVEGFETSRPSLRDTVASNSGDGGGDYSSAPASSRASSSEVDARDAQSFYRWVKSHYSWALAHCSLYENEDFAQLMKVGIILDREVLWEEVIPIMKKQVRTPGHLLAFLGVLLQAVEDQQIPREMGLDTFRAIFYNLHEQRNRPQINHTSYQSTDSWKIASILCHCLKLGLYSEFDQMITKLLQEISTTPIDNLGEAILPLMSIFLNQLLDRSIPLTTPRVRLLFHQGLAIFRQRYIGRQPQEPTNWARPRSTCHCDHCIEFDAFLTDRHAWEIRIAKPFPARIHLESQLSLDGGDGEFRFRTEMESAAHALVVTKNIISARYERESEAWEIRRAAASLTFLELGVQSLRELFGGRFGEVFNMEDGRGGGAPADAEQEGMLSGWGAGGDDDDDTSDEESEIVFLGFY